MDERKKLAIIGGGASAVLILANLAKYPSSQTIDIDVFDRAARFGRGIAYSTEYASHRLNVRAANMSAFVEAPDDFAAWAKKKYTFESDAFVPRGLYALYLDEKLKDALAHLSVKFIQDDVLSSQKTNDDLYAVKAANFYHAYHDVVQATGNVRLLQPVIKGSPAYFAEPWYLETFRNIPEKAHVVLLGSGLSAADAMSSLDTHGFEGKVTVVSRNGWFPREHVKTDKYPGFLDEKALALPPSQLMNLIRREVKKAGTQGIAWQAVIDALRPTTNKTWQAWNDQQRAIFLKRGLTLWNIHRHRMALETAAVIKKYWDEGRLTMALDTILGVEGPARVVCKGGVIEADVIINCLGYRYDEGRSFEVSHKIGPAMFGPLFETTAMPEIRAQAAEIAAKITQI